MLQGHIDMVCDKRAGVEHDFERDGIDLVVKDGILTANGTTLGADNGSGVAFMLATSPTRTSMSTGRCGFCSPWTRRSGCWARMSSTCPN